jgi:hypothetical protein
VRDGHPLCATDNDCVDTLDESRPSNVILKCLMSTVQEDGGICMRENDCFQHTHCPQGFLCSGQGKCVKPVISIKNEYEDDADVQLFSKTGWNTSMHKLTLFDSIPDFATVNCMCSFRNWYHYENTTAGNKAEINMILVRDKLIHHTDQARVQTLQDLQF